MVRLATCGKWSVGILVVEDLSQAPLKIVKIRNVPEDRETVTPAEFANFPFSMTGRKLANLLLD